MYWHKGKVPYVCHIKTRGSALTNLKTKTIMKNQNQINITLATTITASDIAIVAFTIGMVALCVYGIFNI